MLITTDHLDGSERSNILFTDCTNTSVCCNICLMCASHPVQIIILLQLFSNIWEYLWKTRNMQTADRTIAENSRMCNRCSNQCTKDSSLYVLAMRVIRNTWACITLLLKRFRKWTFANRKFDGKIILKYIIQGEGKCKNDNLYCFSVHVPWIVYISPTHALYIKNTTQVH